MMASASGMARSKSAAPKAGAHTKRTELADTKRAGSEVATTVAAEEPKPVEIATAPPPAPENKPAAGKPDRPAWIKVAAAPVVALDKAEEMMKRIKAEAAMRRSSGRTASIAIFSSRF